MNFTKPFFTIFLITLVNSSAFAQKMPKENVIDVPAIGKKLCVHNLFQSNMVLQRGKQVPIWGWADPGEKVTVQFAGQERTATAGESRKWKVVFPKMEANTKAQTLTVKGKQKVLTLKNILIGDVWVLGGQSNMEFPLSRIENGNLEIVSANYPQIRILTVPAMNGPKDKFGFPRLHEWSGWFNRHFRKGDWDVCSPKIVQELSAIGYVFARRIHMATKVPIGIIDASRGGTTVETWTPDAVLRKNPSQHVKSWLADWDERVDKYDAKEDLQARVQRHEQWVARMKKSGKKIPPNRKTPTDLRPGPAMDQNRPGNCYASMISPIAGFPIKGAIFHQGYNNCFNGSQGAKMYRDVFPQMIKAWRSAFDDPKLPFGILSLCTEGTPQTLENFTELMANVGPYIREAQYQTFLEFYRAGDKNIGFTSTYDLRRRWYHPQLKIPAGERIARWALATQYGFENQIRWKPPMVQSMKVESGRIVLTFDETIRGIDDGGPMKGFAIAGKDRKFHPATIEHLVIGKDSRGRPKKDNKVLVLSSLMVSKPVHYRYAWARSPMGNLQSHHNSDIPLATQRSDGWALEQIPLGIFGDTPPEKNNRSQRGKLMQALRKIDLERRIRQAEELLKKHKKLP